MITRLFLFLLLIACWFAPFATFAVLSRKAVDGEMFDRWTGTRLYVDRETGCEYFRVDNRAISVCYDANGLPKCDANRE